MLFKYVERLLIAMDNDCPAVIASLQKARKSWARDFICDPVYWAAVGGVSPQGGVVYLGQATQAVEVRDLVVPFIGGSYAGIWVGRDGYLHLQAPEFGHTIHRDMTYSGPLPGGGVEARNAGSQEVVGAGGAGLHRPMRGEQGGWEQ